MELLNVYMCVCIYATDTNTFSHLCVYMQELNCVATNL